VADASTWCPSTHEGSQGFFFCAEGKRGKKKEQFLSIVAVPHWGEKKKKKRDGPDAILLITPKGKRGGRGKKKNDHAIRTG